MVAIVLLCAPAANAIAARDRLELLHLQHLQAARAAIFSPAPRLSGTYKITGTVEEFDGSRLPYADVQWGWFDPDGDSWSPAAATFHLGGDTQTWNGAFSFAGVSAHPGHDDLCAFSDQDLGLQFIQMWHLDFSTAASYTLRPGHVSVSIAHAPAGKPAYVTLGDAAASIAESRVGLSGGKSVADAAPPDFNSATVSYENDFGTVTAECEPIGASHVPVAVSPGTTAAGPLAFDWSTAVRGHLVGPICQHSGRPGDSVEYAISNLPTGEQISFVGMSFSPDDWGTEVCPQVVTSAGPEQTYTVTLGIPSRATVGDIYMIEALRADDDQSLLDLYDYYQVCSFSASRALIPRGGGVRLRGQVAGPDATLFMCSHAAGQPASVKAPGWTKVADLNVADNGKFVTATLHPRRSTWYVVRYSGGDFAAFTPVVSVLVHPRPVWHRMEGKHLVR